MGLPISTSPNITFLDFLPLYDISGAVPVIKITNNSVGNPSGVAGLNLIKWWFVITSPSGTPIHTGSLVSPDIYPGASAWTTFNIPEPIPNALYASGPCAEIEFSSGVPYSCTLSIEDNIGQIYNLTKTTLIVRPSGCTPDTCGNFGAAVIGLQVQCNNGRIYAEDDTNYSYQGILPSPISNNWSLIYPPDATGTYPTPGAASATPYVYFPIQYPGSGYQIYLNAYVTYNLGNGCLVKIQYKSNNNNNSTNSFGVYCNIDTCKIQCEVDKFREKLKQSCGTVQNTKMKDQADQISLLMGQINMALIQPLCGTDVMCLIKEIEKIGNFSCDCCSNTGINGSNPSGSACCPPAPIVPVVSSTCASVAPVNMGWGGFFPPSSSSIVGGVLSVCTIFSPIAGAAGYQLVLLPVSAGTPSPTITAGVIYAPNISYGGTVYSAGTPPAGTPTISYPYPAAIGIQWQVWIRTVCSLGTLTVVSVWTNPIAWLFTL